VGMISYWREMCLWKTIVLNCCGVHPHVNVGQLGEGADELKPHLQHPLMAKRLKYTPVILEPRFIDSARTTQKIPLLLSEYLRNLATSCSMAHREHTSYCCVFAGTCILSRCLAMITYCCHALKREGVYRAVA
jgi:hypothetical protein